MVHLTSSHVKISTPNFKQIKLKFGVKGQNYVSYIASDYFSGIKSVQNQKFSLDIQLN